MNFLVLNPGGNSLKIEAIQTSPGQHEAAAGTKALSVMIEGIGDAPCLWRLAGKKKIAKKKIDAHDYGEATAAFLEWWRGSCGSGCEMKLSDTEAIAIRVVHGGSEFGKPVLLDEEVVSQISRLEKLAPLHNRTSLDVLDAIRPHFAGLPIYAVFDTAFHRTMPEHAWRYAVPEELWEKYRVRRYGFHGISHRYLLDRFARLSGKPREECTIVSLHLESGCSVTAIRRGESIDNTMGMTPLEGVMMGTRSGDIDPSVVPLLMRESGMSIEEVMTLLNKKSGLLGVSRLSLDTRVLMKQYGSDSRAKLAMDMFVYRLRKAVGGYLAALESVDAIVFGGGIGEDTAFVREAICGGLDSLGVKFDKKANEGTIDIEGRITLAGSRIHAWVVPTEEGLEMAHECLMAMRG